jgi:3'-5' exoribonuclease 1
MTRKQVDGEIEQHFEYIAVVDFEATCEEKPGNNFRNEIIEFPIVLINVKEQTIVNYFDQIKLITDPLLLFF